MPDSEIKRTPLQKRWLVLAGIVLLALIFLIPFIREGGARVDTSVEVETQRVVSGEIRETAPGTGRIVSAESRPVEAACAGRIAQVTVQNGDEVEAGDVIASYDTQELTEQIQAVLVQIQELDEQVSEMDTASSYDVTVESAGLVKTVTAATGMATGEGCQVVLSTDGRLSIMIRPAGEYEPSEGDTVTVVLGEDREPGQIETVDGENGDITVTFADGPDYLPGQQAVVTDADGVELGRGEVEIHRPYLAAAQKGGIVSQVAVQPGDTLEAGDVVFSCIDREENQSYLSLLEERMGQIELLFELQQLQTDPNLRAKAHGTIESLSLSSGDQVEAGTQVCALASTQTFTAQVQLAQFDAQRVLPGQVVELVFDELGDRVWYGQVTEIEDADALTAAVRLENAQGLQVGMTGECQVILCQCEDAVLVPARAVQAQKDGAEVVELYYGDGLTQIRTVKTGLRSDGTVQILQGVQPGENVVVASHVVETKIYTFFNHEWIIGQEEGPSEDGPVLEPENE